MTHEQAVEIAAEFREADKPIIDAIQALNTALKGMEDVGLIPEVAPVDTKHPERVCIDWYQTSGSIKKCRLRIGYGYKTIIG